MSFRCAGPARSRLPDLTTLTPEALQVEVAQNFHRLKTFEGRARVIIELPGQGYNGFSHVYIKLPDSVFVKTEAMLGIDIGALFIDQNYFGAYAPRENTLYYGETESLDLRDFLQVEIDTDELFEVFTGLIQLELASDATLRRADGQLVVSTNQGDERVDYWIDPRTGIVKKSVTRNAAGEVVLRKEFSRFRKHDGVILPQTIKLTRPLAKERITVYYTRQRVNRKIDQKHFVLRPDKKAKRVYWGDLEHPRVERRLPK